MEENKKVINWCDNPNFITTLAISVLALIIILSQSFAVKNNIGTNDILRSLLNHNSIYLLGLIYFIPLKTLSGKKYFNHLNVFLIIVYGVFTVTGVLTIIQSFGLTSLVNLAINLILLIYMIHTLLIDTKIWKDFKLEKSPLNEIKSENYYYVLVILAIVLLTVNLIQTSTVAGAIVSLLGCIYTCILSRYIYLYKMHIDNKNALKAEKKEKKNIVKSKEKNNKTAKDNNKKQEDK